MEAKSFWKLTRFDKIVTHWINDFVIRSLKHLIKENLPSICCQGLGRKCRPYLEDSTTIHSMTQQLFDAWKSCCRQHPSFSFFHLILSRSSLTVSSIVLFQIWPKSLAQLSFLAKKWFPIEYFGQKILPNEYFGQEMLPNWVFGVKILLKLGIWAKNLTQTNIMVKKSCPNEYFGRRTLILLIV